MTNQLRFIVVSVMIDVYVFYLQHSRPYVLVTSKTVQEPVRNFNSYSQNSTKQPPLLTYISLLPFPTVILYEKLTSVLQIQSGTL